MSDKNYYSIQDEREDSESMIFPLNILSSVRAKSAMSGSEKTSLVLMLWVFGCGIIAWMLVSFFIKVIPKYAILVTVLILVFLNATIGVVLLRYLLDERSVVKEYEASDGASFASFFKIYRDTQLTLNDKYGVVEYSDGTYGVFLRFRLGYNTNQFAANTWMYMRDAMRIISSAGFTSRMITSTEDFKSSDTCRFMMERLKGIEIPELLEVQKEIIRGLLDEAEKKSNVPVIHLIIYAKTQIQKDDLLGLMQLLERHFIVEQTCFRDIKFLNNDEITAFLQKYYELEVLDMSLLRAQKLSADVLNKDSLPILKLYGLSGKTYSTEDMKTLNSRIIKETGIKKVN